MTRVLYINASPMGELSFSTAVADAFVEEYKKLNPKHQIDTMKLFDEDIPSFNFPAAAAKYNIMHQKEYSHRQRRIWDRVEYNIEHFKNADKYIFAVPMWNFSIPWRLKQYIDIIVQPGYTFDIDEQGNYKGLVGDKPAFLVYARGGDYSENPQLDNQKPYMELILGFMGIKNINSITVQPTLQGGPEQAEKIKKIAIEKARNATKDF